MDRLADVVALVLTHGHEDHIGAVPYLLRQRPDIPLVGSKLTLALVSGEDPRASDPRHRATRGDRSAADTVRRIRCRIPGGQSLHSGFPRGDGANASRNDPAHRRLQDGSAAPGQQDHRPALLRPPRAGRRGSVPGRLHQRGGARIHDAGTRYRTRLGPGFRAQPPADHRGLLRLTRPSGPADHGRCRHAWPQGRLRRTLHGPEHGCGPRSRLPAGARRHPDRLARHRGSPAGRRGDHLHRIAGRAALRIVQDGQPRPPGDHACGRETPWCWPARSSLATRARCIG